MYEHIKFSKNIKLDHEIIDFLSTAPSVLLDRMRKCARYAAKVDCLAATKTFTLLRTIGD